MSCISNAPELWRALCGESSSADFEMSPNVTWVRTSPTPYVQRRVFQNDITCARCTCWRSAASRCFTNSMRNADWCLTDPCCWMVANTSMTWPNIMRAWGRITCSSVDILWFTARTLSASVSPLWTWSTLSRSCYLLFVTAYRRITGQHQTKQLNKNTTYAQFYLLLPVRRNPDSK